MDKLLNDDLIGLEENLKEKIREAAETIDAIKNNKIDALLVTTEEGEKILTLHETESIYRVILDSIESAAVTFTEEGTIIYSNRRFNEILKLNGKISSGLSVYEFISPSSAKVVESFLLTPDDNVITEIELIGNDEKLIPVNVSHKTVSQDGAQPFIIMLFNVPDRQTNQKLEPESYFKSIINLTSDAIIVCDINGKILRYNRSAIILSNQTLLNTNFDLVFNLYNGNGDRVSFKELYHSEELPGYELLFNRTDGKILYLNLVKEVLKDVHGDAYGFVVTINDITKHILAQTKALSALKEKTVLLKEIHHRIKNNLQIVSSIINIQSHYITDPKSLEIFSELKSRIKSISLVHEKLYESDSFIDVPMDQYIMELVKYLKDSFNLKNEAISFNFDLDSISIIPEQVISLGLIINELITNSVKYAFPERKGNIKISLKQDEDNIILTVADNGIGMPYSVNIEESESLGLLLIKTLTGQLGGRIECKNDHGIKVKIIFSNVNQTRLLA